MNAIRSDAPLNSTGGVDSSANTSATPPVVPSPPPGAPTVERTPAAPGPAPVDRPASDQDSVAAPDRAARAPKRARRTWLSTFFTGLVLWIASVIVTGLTSNLNMIPTVVLLGSFLVPATAVIWYLDHYRSDVLTPALAARAFIVHASRVADSHD